MDNSNPPHTAPAFHEGDFAMATGLEAFDGLKQKTQGYPAGGYATVSSLEALDLRKLTPQDLVSRGYAEGIADAVSHSLLDGDLAPLGESCGLHLSISTMPYTVAQLLDPRNQAL